MIILIRNIDREANEQDLLKRFYYHGTVNSFDIIKDQKTGLSKGFGFVDMPKEKEALKAIADLNNYQFGKSVLRVKKAARSSILKNKNKTPEKRDEPRRKPRR